MYKKPSSSGEDVEARAVLAGAGGRGPEKAGMRVVVWSILIKGEVLVSGPTRGRWLLR